MIAVQERRGFAFNNVVSHNGCFHPRNEKRRPATRARLRAVRAICAAVAAAWLAAVAGCNEAEGQRPSGDSAHARSGSGESAAAITIAKWFNNHTAAISITYDDWPDVNHPVDDFVLDMGLVLDFQMVTQGYADRVPDWVEHDLTELIPHVVPGASQSKFEDQRIKYNLALTARGFGFYGHGHWHVDHDVLTYAQAHDSFRLCFEVMQKLGLKPVAYAYPRGAGLEEETRRALSDAGFLAGRLSSPAGQSPYIVADAATTPEDWFLLPALTMEDYDFQQCGGCINNTEELLPFLDAAIEKTAWIIPVYHNIGRSTGWGPYGWEDFQGDVRAIAARDFWVAPMNDVVLYIREREKAVVEMAATERDGTTEQIRFALSDGLDNERFDQPLTLVFTPPSDWAGLPIHVTQDGRHVDWIFPAAGEAATFSVPPDEKPYIIKPKTGL